MVLMGNRHLLGKKSWNVYNTDNIEKVRRDEARHAAEIEAEEQRMQELDAERRMQILRGEVPTPLAIEDVPGDDDAAGDRRHEARNRGHDGGRERKVRKRAGENDTDFEMRIALEREEKRKEGKDNEERRVVQRKVVDAPLTDGRGHIDLFPQDQQVKKNPEAERELAKKKKEYEDQYTMRFSNAAGFKVALESPWYSKASEAQEEDAVTKNVWAEEDPRRKDRQAARIMSSDPLAMMKRGARMVRQVEKERKEWREVKERELRELKEVERSARHKRRRDHDSEDVDEEPRRKRSGESRKRNFEVNDVEEFRRRHRGESGRERDDEGGRERTYTDERSEYRNKSPQRQRSRYPEERKYRERSSRRDDETRHRSRHRHHRE